MVNMMHPKILKTALSRLVIAVCAVFLIVLADGTMSILQADLIDFQTLAPGHIEDRQAREHALLKRMVGAAAVGAGTDAQFESLLKSDIDALNQKAVNTGREILLAGTVDRDSIFVLDGECYLKMKVQESIRPFKFRPQNALDAIFDKDSYEVEIDQAVYDRMKSFKRILSDMEPRVEILRALLLSADSENRRLARRLLSNDYWGYPREDRAAFEDWIAFMIKKEKRKKSRAGGQLAKEWGKLLPEIVARGTFADKKQWLMSISPPTPKVKVFGERIAAGTRRVAAAADCGHEKG